ncbi:S9 family peptidase [Mangrovibacterium lignilyticum]|uniref:S9 family peptidase n=1 Tax=Mangrovibacterium lignilyticum TaxID=2668052 RepID=UPI001EE60023|nr:S9 family peptidase [Mangrovibacterium lignilyticum]
MAKKIPHELTVHGHTRVDNYYWLNQREDSAVLDYLNAENAYTEKVMAHTAALQEKLYEEIKDRIKQDDESVPFLSNGYYYYTRTVPETEYHLLCRKKGSTESDEEILLDVNQLAKGHPFYAIGGSSVSTNNQILAYGADTVSRRNYTVYFKNLETGELLADEIPMTTGHVVWANDNKTVFYTLRDEETLRSIKIMKHVLGTPIEDDQEVFYEDDETFGVGIFKTKGYDYLMIVSFSTLTTEYQFLDANKPEGNFTVLQPRTRGLEYSANYYNGYFYIRTNLDAQNFRLMKTPVQKPGKDNWIEVIPEREDVFIEGFDLFKNYMVVQERKEGLSLLRVMPWKGDEHYISFDEEVYSAWISTNKEYDTNMLRFGYSSLTTPSSVFDYNMDSREKKLMKRQPVIGDFDPANYEAKREYAIADDGTKIPMSIVYHKGLKKDGNNPAMIYGYGSYGNTIDPTFSSSRLSLLDRGFVYAIAHIRGGQINGRKWYDNGKLLKKRNTFTDFIACSEHLIDSKYTNSDKLFAKGGSAGGLLMGAVVNMRPDLYKGIIAAVPFVDVVTTMLDESIPLTTGEFDEWGNPKEKEYYDYILSYSPYDQVEAKDYPAMLVTTGLHDSQVQYWEPTKWVAKLRDLKTDDNPLLLKINMDYGHGGASGRFEWIRELALEDAFIFDQLGIEG